MLPDNTLLVKRESESDNRPFIAGMEPSTKTQVAFDTVNFGSKSDVLEFVRSIEAAVGQGFVSETHLIRKSAIPDPELVFTISEAIITYLLGKKIIEKVGDKVFSQVADDLANFYSLVKTASYQMAKYAIPNNRPITYVFNTPGTPNIELVAITNSSSLLNTALDETKLRAIFSNADNYRSLLNAEKVQYFLNSEGEWEFNYLLTEEGAVIGTIASFDRQARVFNLLFSKKDEGERGVVSEDESRSSKPAKELLAKQRRRLHKLKEKQAVYGQSVDPQVLIEIEDLEAEIKNLESEL